MVELSIHPGAHLDRPPGPKYRDSFRFAELGPAHPLPRADTLKRWRNALPDDFVLSLVLPRPAWVGAKGALRPDEEMERALGWATEAAETLGARFVVLPTASELTTGQRDRNLLAEYAERWAGDGQPQLVWAPSGLWEAEDAEPLARRLGLVYGFDPLESEAPRGPVVYARLRAIGLRARFTETMLLEVAERLGDAEGAREAFVAIQSPQSFKEAQRLAELLRAEE